MRNIKQILRGEFPGDKKRITHFKCNSCGYVNRTGCTCPACLSKNCEAVDDSEVKFQ